MGIRRFISDGTGKIKKGLQGDYPFTAPWINTADTVFWTAGSWTITYEDSNYNSSLYLIMTANAPSPVFSNRAYSSLGLSIGIRVTDGSNINFQTMPPGGSPVSINLPAANQDWMVGYNTGLPGADSVSVIKIAKMTSNAYSVLEAAPGTLDPGGSTFGNSNLYARFAIESPQTLDNSIVNWGLALTTIQGVLPTIIGWTGTVAARRQSIAKNVVLDKYTAHVGDIITLDFDVDDPIVPGSSLGAAPLAEMCIKPAASFTVLSQNRINSGVPADHNHGHILFSVNTPGIYRVVPNYQAGANTLGVAKEVYSGVLIIKP